MKSVKSKPKKNPKKFPYQPNQELPKIINQTKWDLETLFYSGTADEQLEKDLKKVESLFASFSRKYQKLDFMATPETLASALKDYFALDDKVSAKPALYFWYRNVLDTHDHEAEKQSNLISDRFTKAGNQLIFFTLKIGHLEKKRQAIFLKSEVLAPYKYFLKTIFNNAKYELSEAEEKILNLKNLPSYSLWVSGTEKILQRQTVTFQKKTYPLNEALEKIAEVKPSERTPLWKATRAVLKNNALVAENELNAIILDKKIEDELRGYKTPYEAKVLANENNLRSVEALVETVSDRGFALSRQFYKLKASLAGVENFNYANRFDPLTRSPEPIIDFATAAEICRDVFYGVKNEYGEFFDNMLTKGHIDAFPKPGRGGGAFMSTTINTPILVFLNHTNTFRSLETLAHEMGHALHSHRTKASQPTYYQNYSLTTAETASTLFENLVFEAIYKQVDDKAKITLLHDRLIRDISTIQRQIAFFNFEKRIHEIVRTEGAITHERLAQCFANELRAYLGKGINVEDDDGYSFVMVSHFRSMFYVYTYAYGLLMSNLMNQRYQSDPDYITKIDEFLCSGSKDNVENIFKNIGIRADRTETFNESLNAMADSIKELSRLTKKT